MACIGKKEGEAPLLYPYERQTCSGVPVDVARGSRGLWTGKSDLSALQEGSRQAVTPLSPLQAKSSAQVHRSHPARHAAFGSKGSTIGRSGGDHHYGRRGLEDAVGLQAVRHCQSCGSGSGDGKASRGVCGTSRVGNSPYYSPYCLKSRANCSSAAPTGDGQNTMKHPVFTRVKGWCREQESNLQGTKYRRILSPLRLPVPPSRPCFAIVYQCWPLGVDVCCG